MAPATTQDRAALTARIPASLQRKIEAGIYWVECSAHAVKQLPVSWAEAHGQFAHLFEWLAINALRESAVQ